MVTAESRIQGNVVHLNGPRGTPPPGNDSCPRAVVVASSLAEFPSESRVRPPSPRGLFMRSHSPIMLLIVLLASAGTAPHRALPLVRPNPNTSRAGVLRGGVLTVALEARQSTWRLNGPQRPPMTIAAFSEAGRAPLMPGPLIRAGQGTAIHLSVRNSLSVPLTFLIPAAIHGGPEQAGALDSLVIAPGAVGVLNTRATVPGNYVYRATTPTAASRDAEIAGLLAGALVVDTSGAAPPAHDRVFVIMATPDSTLVSYADTATTRFPLRDSPIGRIIFTINGRSWPNTERISATAGDTLHWRVINASIVPHPMHLHGFYYRVDGMTGPLAASFQLPARGEMVVTQLLHGLWAMSMTWSPDRPGNWIFHCHLAVHLQPDSLSAEPGDSYLRGMVGLVLGVNVAARPGARAASALVPVRHLRLIAVAGSPTERDGHATALAASAAKHFVLEENGRRVETETDMSPELDLTRGEPVSIMIVNHLAEPTSVHWHGIEVQDSYVDGVVGFSGAAGHLSPEIAPGDSFEARFTPPRSGTFMYHAHMNEMRAELAGLEGALIVRDSGSAPSADDHVFFLKGINAKLQSLAGEPAHPLEVNGMTNPDTVVLHVGRLARLRFLNLTTVNVEPLVSITARPDSSLTGVGDTMTVHWLPLAKDGFDLPAAARHPRLARQELSIGETYDFAYMPSQRGNVRLEIRGNGGKYPLLIRVPIRVE